MRKWMERVIVILLVTGLIALSDWKIEAGILLGSLYLLLGQAGGLEELQRLYEKFLLPITVWTIGMLLNGFLCPTWMIYLILVLANITVFLFAPISRIKAASRTIEERRIRKNRAIFVTGALSVFVLLTKDKPVAVMALIPLVLETGIIMGIITKALFRKKPDTTIF